MDIHNTKIKKQAGVYKRIQFAFYVHRNNAQYTIVLSAKASKFKA